MEQDDESPMFSSMEKEDLCQGYSMEEATKVAAGHKQTVSIWGKWIHVPSLELFAVAALWCKTVWFQLFPPVIS